MVSHAHSPSRPAAPRAAARQQPNRRLTWLLILAASLLVLAHLVFALHLLFEFAGPVAPNVRVGGTPVGGLSVEQAAAEIDAQWNVQRRVRITGPGLDLPVSPLELGYYVDAQASARAAWELGRKEGRWSELASALSANQPLEMEPVVVFSRESARRGLENLAAQVGLPDQDASVEFRDGRWQAVAAQEGLALDVDATLAALESDMEGVLYNGVLPATLRPVAPAVRDVSAVVAELEARRTTPLVLQAYDPITDEHLQWSIGPDVFSSWIRVDSVDGQPHMSLDPAPLQEYIAGLAASFNDGRTFGSITGLADLNASWQSGQPLQALLRHPATVYTVQPGDTLLKVGWKTGMPYWRIQNANPGINPDALITGQNLTIPSKDDLLPLPVVPDKRIVITISQQRMWTYENGQQRSEHIISTGIDRSPTQPGVFQIQTHEESAYASLWDLTMPNFMGIYESWPGFMNGIHGLPTLSSGRILWEGSLGKPASYGCIILPLQAAADLFTWAEAGVVVEIRE